MTAEIWDVIVVGAGLSGLSAAHVLRKRNSKLKILVLEGKDRVGGRTVTCEIPAANGKDRWDFGGQWVGSSHVIVQCCEVKKSNIVDLYTYYVRTYVYIFYKIGFFLPFNHVTLLSSCQKTYLEFYFCTHACFINGHSHFAQIVAS
uniref:Amine oxidase domain-containing protein n=1 Tax=Periophthalmus magnuspinnatus TaxID=409849 RepID=A0A3B4BK42_9GOBI